jgi:hypothetical protein
MSVKTIGEIMLTNDGLNALAQAQASGTKIKVTHYKQIERELTFDPRLKSKDIKGWRSHALDRPTVVSESVVSYIVDCPIDKALNFTRTIALFMENGLLYALAKPPFPIPPNVRQRFELKIGFSNLATLMSFNYANSEEFDKELRELQHTALIGSMLLKNTKEITTLKIKGEK